MTGLLWLGLLAYVFGIGYCVVGKIDKFIRSNSRAFPGARKIKVTPEICLQHYFEDDGSCNPWYNGATNFGETERL